MSNEGTVELFVGRHTEFEEDGPNEGQLTDEGLEQAKRIAAMFGKKYPPGAGEPPLVLHSDATRSVALASLVADATGTGPQRGNWAVRGPKTMDVLADTCRGHKVVIVCGHDPLLDAIMKLATGRGYRHAPYGMFLHFRLIMTGDAADDRLEPAGVLNAGVY